MDLKVFSYNFYKKKLRNEQMGKIFIFNLIGCGRSNLWSKIIHVRIENVFKKISKNAIFEFLSEIEIERNKKRLP